MFDTARVGLITLLAMISLSGCLPADDAAQGNGASPPHERYPDLPALEPPMDPVLTGSGGGMDLVTGQSPGPVQNQDHTTGEPRPQDQGPKQPAPVLPSNPASSSAAKAPRDPQTSTGTSLPSDSTQASLTEASTTTSSQAPATSSSQSSATSSNPRDRSQAPPQIAKASSSGPSEASSSTDMAPPNRTHPPTGPTTKPSSKTELRPNTAGTSTSPSTFDDPTRPIPVGSTRPNR